jgi:hypothetical protein
MLPPWSNVLSSAYSETSEVHTLEEAAWAVLMKDCAVMVPAR